MFKTDFIYITNYLDIEYTPDEDRDFDLVSIIKRCRGRCLRGALPYAAGAQRDWTLANYLAYFIKHD